MRVKLLIIMLVTLCGVSMNAATSLSEANPQKKQRTTVTFKGAPSDGLARFQITLDPKWATESPTYHQGSKQITDVPRFRGPSKGHIEVFVFLHAASEDIFNAKLTTRDIKLKHPELVKDVGFSSYSGAITTLIGPSKDSTLPRIMLHATLFSGQTMIHVGADFYDEVSVASYIEFERLVRSIKPVP